MIKMIRLSMALAVLVCATGAAVAAPEPAKNQMAERFQFEKAQRIQVDYLLFLPKDYKKGGSSSWPLMLFLHGAGERGSDVWKVSTHGPPRNVAAHADFPFIVVSPQCPEGQTWSNDVLLGLLEEIETKYAVDKRRIYLTGLSMGGYGTWSLGLSHPEKFAAIVPICGGGEFITLLLSSRDNGDALKSLGVWAFHGAKDPVVPVGESERMVAGLKKAGVSEVKLTIYPEAGHDAWTETYKNPELYEWLLKHQRTDARSGKKPRK